MALPQPAGASAPADDTLIDIQGLKVHFPIRGGLFGRTVASVKAVDGVDLKVKRGEVLGLVGESGCGKSTLGRAVLQLIKPTGGHVFFEGEDLVTMPAGRLRHRRADMQMVFQDPYSALDPRFTVGAVIAEPLTNFNFGSRDQMDERIRYLLKVVGMSPNILNRYAHEFSGGQRQRIGIARALALNPRFIVADEPISALDVSIQAQVLESAGGAAVGVQPDVYVYRPQPVGDQAYQHAGRGDVPGAYRGAWAGGGGLRESAAPVYDRAALSQPVPGPGSGEDAQADHSDG